MEWTEPGGAEGKAVMVRGEESLEKKELSVWASEMIACAQRRE